VYRRVGGQQTNHPAATPWRSPPKVSRPTRFEKATNQFRKAADQAQGMANRVAERGRQAGERIQEVAGNIKGSLDTSLRDQPMATLVTAAMVGFVLGALWKL
jgi:ElaB/YqjD/DUF883 family membrane-anchored ribosome-binding protein